jgi:outer membrane protein assembly factor BamD (BamD/ComL family)
MRSYPYIMSILVLVSLSLILNQVCWAQVAATRNPQLDSDVEMLKKAEEDIRLLDTQTDRKDINIARRVEKALKNILQLYPNTNLRAQIEEHLNHVQEILGVHNLLIAYFYFDRGQVKGVEARLLTVVREYPKFSRMDEVLLLLGKVYVKWEQPEDAANYLRRLVCNYSSSKYISAAFEQLNQIGINASGDCDKLKPE